VATSAAGALLGAMLGEAGIPATWRARLHEAAGLRSMADRLLQGPA
jgi:ADP-ribosylglycohydrolase